MAHAGEKFALAAVGLLRLFLALFQSGSAVVDVVLEIVLILLKVTRVVINGDQHAANGLG